MLPERHHRRRIAVFISSFEMSGSSIESQGLLREHSRGARKNFFHLLKLGPRSPVRSTIDRRLCSSSTLLIKRAVVLAALNIRGERSGRPPAEAQASARGLE